jgi:hypothetical protein
MNSRRAAVLVVTLMGCPKRVDGEDPVPALLRQADNAWDARGTQGFEPVIVALDLAFQAERGRADVLWRLARLHVAQGLAAEEPRDAMREFGTARGLALECLDLEPGYLQRRRQGEVTPALEALGQPEGPCLVWAGLAWTQWMALMGGGAAALDLEALDALLARGEQLDNGDSPGVISWSRGLLYAIRPPVEGGDLDAARRELQAAIEASPELARRRDLLRWVAVPTKDTVLAREQVEAARQAVAMTPEDVRAAKTILAFGLD